MQMTDFQVDVDVNNILRQIPEKSLQEKFLNDFEDSMREMQKKEPSIPSVEKLSSMLSSLPDSGSVLGCIAGILRFHPAYILSPHASGLIKLIKSLEGKKEFNSFISENMAKWKKKIFSKFGDLEEEEKRTYFSLIKII